MYVIIQNLYYPQILNDLQTPFALYLVVALGTPFLMFACGVTLEILTALSAANGGVCQYLFLLRYIEVIIR